MPTGVTAMALLLKGTADFKAVILRRMLSW